MYPTAWAVPDREFKMSQDRLLQRELNVIIIHYFNPKPKYYNFHSYQTIAINREVSTHGV